MVYSYSMHSYVWHSFDIYESTFVISLCTFINSWTTVLFSQRIQRIETGPCSIHWYWTGVYSLLPLSLLSLAWDACDRVRSNMVIDTTTRTDINTTICTRVVYDGLAQKHAPKKTLQHPNTQQMGPSLPCHFSIFFGKDTYLEIPTTPCNNTKSKTK